MKRAKIGVNRYYMKVILSFVVFALLLTLLSSVLLYVNYQEYMLKLINQYNQDVLRQVSDHMGEINHNATTNIFYILNNPSARRLLFNKEYRDYDLNQYLFDINIMNNLRLSNPYIHSIYLFNAKENEYSMIGAQTNIGKKEIYDSDVPELIKNYTGTNPVPRIIPYSEYEANREIVVYTYILKDFNAIETNLPYTIIINVYADALFSLNISSKQESGMPNEIFCITPKGQVVASQDQDIIMKDISGLPYIAELLETDIDEGYFLYKEKNDKKILVFTKSPILDWILVYVIPYGNVSHMLDNVRAITIILFTIILIIGSLCAYFISKNLYRPIEQLKKAVKGKSPFNTENEKRLNEIEFLEQQFEQMQFELEEIGKKNRKSAQYTKSSILLNILKGAVPDEQEANQVFQQFNIPLAIERPTYMILFQIDNYEKDYTKRFSSSQQALYKFALNNLTCEITGDKFLACGSVDPGEDFVVTIISIENEDVHDDEIRDSLKQCIQKIQKAYHDLVQISISGFISRKCGNLYEIRAAYLETVNLSRQRFVYGHGCILSVEEHGIGESFENIVNEKQTDELISSLKSGNAKLAEQIFISIKSCWSRAGYESIHYGIDYIFYSVVQLVMSIEAMSRVKFNIDFMEYYDRIKKSETFDISIIAFRQLFQDVAFAIDDMKGGKTDIIVQKVNRFIEENYMIDHLSVNNIADHVALSPHYINRVYKLNTGSSIADYIKNFRLEKAIYLLKHTEFTVDEILQKIGWHTKEYFYIVFKKQFGMTPGEFRASMQLQEPGG